mmetsp:Transcript_125474/g.313479  ORF Transcript_125474/g.313479 Transcript_125474/m.313479 type:complete len:216 (-) Transcript_125474:912-1559(-)
MRMHALQKTLQNVTKACRGAWGNRHRQEPIKHHRDDEAAPSKGVRLAPLLYPAGTGTATAIARPGAAGTGFNLEVSRFCSVGQSKTLSGNSSTCLASISTASTGRRDFIARMTMPTMTCSVWPDEISIIISKCLPWSCRLSIFTCLPINAGFFGTERRTSHGPSSTEKMTLRASLCSSGVISRKRFHARACGVSSLASASNHGAFGSTAPTMTHW